MKALARFLGTIIAILGVIWFAGTVINNLADIPTEHAPDQVIMLNNYVISSGTTQDQANTTKTLAEADAIIRDSQNRRVNAETEATDANTHQALGAANAFFLIGMLVIFALIAAVIAKRIGME